MVDHVALAVRPLLDCLAVPARVVARAIGYPVSSLWSLCQRGLQLAAGKAIAPPGPEPKLPDALRRNDILMVIHASAGRISVEELREAFPGVTRQAIRALQRRYLKLTRKRERRSAPYLSWELEGAVWAMDHTDFQGGIEDTGRSVLVVRELATGATLYAGPCGYDAASVCLVLDLLFQEYGAPIAMKCDNGSGFIAEDTKLLLAMYGVLALYSPPGIPSYNGSCEAGVGSIKSRALDFAAARGELVASRNDLHMAQEQANVNVVVAPCRPMVEALRGEVWSRYRKWEARVREEQGLAPDGVLDHAEQASLDRFAVGKALTETKILMIRRRDYRC